MTPEDVLAVLHELGLTEGGAWTREGLLSQLRNAAGVRVEEIGEPGMGVPLTILLGRVTDGARFRLSFEPATLDWYSGSIRYSLGTVSREESPR